MYINGKWMTEPEIEAHIAKLKKQFKEIQAENAELKHRISELEEKHWNECRQIAHYEDELRKAKELLKAAVKDINFYVDCYESHCDECCCSQDNHCHWKHETEALALIGKDGENNGTDNI